MTDSPVRKPTLFRMNIPQVLLLAAGLGMAFWVAARCLLVVDETQFVVVTEFGRPVAVYGDAADESGPHVKWPWQESRSIDRRIRVAQPASRELITGDKHNLDMATFVAWRVIDPLRFVRAASTLEDAEARLDERVTSALGIALGKHTLASLATTDAATWSLDRLSQESLDLTRAAANEELGIDVLTIGLRRFGYPMEVRPAVFDLIRSERQRVAANLRAEGEARYQVVLSEAEREKAGVLAEADAKAQRIRAEGEAEATRILNSAHAQDPEFYTFLRTLETYEALLDKQATLVISASSPLLRLLREGPMMPTPTGAETPANVTGVPVSGSANPAVNASRSSR